MLEAMAVTADPAADPATGLRNYLDQAMSSGLIPAEVAERAWQGWDQVARMEGGRLAVPDACPGAVGQILYTWDRAEHHLEMEVFPEGPFELFYRNRLDGRLWSCDITPGAEVPAEACPYLELFRQA